jgi:hypothetical protein
LFEVVHFADEMSTTCPSGHFGGTAADERLPRNEVTGADQALMSS